VAFFELIAGKPHLPSVAATARTEGTLEPAEAEPAAARADDPS
jgi:hypothetical protein